MCDQYSKGNEANEKENIQSQYETCVCCGCPTNVRKGTSIHLRKHFVEGAGELCEACFGKVFRETT